jgi:hypothetical protein
MRPNYALSISIILSLMFFGACGGVSWQALRITGKSQIFCSLAKIEPVMDGGTDRSGENTLDVYGVFTETLESPEMLQKAKERVRALHPDLKESQAEIEVRQLKGSSVLNVLATGSDPRFTQIILNAILDEFMAFRRAVREHAGKEGSGVAVQQRATTAAEHTDDWKLPIFLGGAGGAFAGLMIGLGISLLIAFLGKSKAPPVASP